MEKIQQLWRELYQNREEQVLGELLSYLQQQKKAHFAKYDDEQWYQKAVVYSLYVQFFDNTIEGLKKRLPYLQTDSRIIQIYSNLLEYNRANSRSYKRSLHFINKFLRLKHIVEYENSNIAQRIGNAIMYSKRALNELVSIYISLPENSFYSNKLKEATSVIHKILNDHIEEMKHYNEEYWKDKPLTTEYSPLQEYYGPHPNDTETTYYSENFSLY